MALSENEVAEIREELRRCSPETVAAALRFRETGDVTAVPEVIYGLIALYTPATAKLPLKDANDNTRLVEDLGLDSLSLLEMVFSIEGVLKSSTPSSTRPKRRKDSSRPPRPSSPIQRKWCSTWPASMPKAAISLMPPR